MISLSLKPEDTLVIRVNETIKRKFKLVQEPGTLIYRKVKKHDSLSNSQVCKINENKQKNLKRMANELVGMPIKMAASRLRMPSHDLLSMLNKVSETRLTRNMYLQTSHIDLIKRYLIERLDKLNKRNKGKAWFYQDNKIANLPLVRLGNDKAFDKIQEVGGYVILSPKPFRR